MTTESEQFVLRSSLSSPFVRKVRIAAEVLGLTDRIHLDPTDAADPTDSLRRQNPLGKYPCLVRADGTAIFDSSVIVEFLQAVAGTDRLHPAGDLERFTRQTRSRLADGIIDAGAAIIYEQRYHPSGTESSIWIEYQQDKIRRALAAFETDLPDPLITDIVSIGLACALGFLERRQPIAWPVSTSRLPGWLEEFAAHEPSFGRTSPPAA